MKTIKSKITERELIDFKKRRYARIAVQNALKKGNLVRADECKLCFEKTFVEAHHIDYGQPFAVMWLCTTCHGKAHRKNSKWNPENNSQSPMPFIAEKKQTVTVSFTLPIKNFLSIQKQADNSKQPIAKLLRDEILKRYPVIDDQLDLFEGVNFDKSQTMPYARVQRLEQNEKLLLQPKHTVLSKIRCARDTDMRDVEGKLLNIFAGNGQDAGELQRIKTN